MRVRETYHCHILSIIGRMMCSMRHDVGWYIWIIGFDCRSDSWVRWEESAILVPCMVV